jgi:hypothetical protein
MCNTSCNECTRKIFSTGVSLVTVDGTDTLVIDVPEQTFSNCQRGCFVITQSIPDTVTISTPVAISIGGVTTTVYPLVTCTGGQVLASQLRTRRRYPFRVDAISATFVILRNLSCAAVNTFATIPAGG